MRGAAAASTPQALADQTPRKASIRLQTRMQVIRNCHGRTGRRPGGPIRSRNPDSPAGPDPLAMRGPFIRHGRRLAVIERGADAARIREAKAMPAATGKPRVMNPSRVPVIGRRNPLDAAGLLASSGCPPVFDRRTSGQCFRGRGTTLPPTPVRGVTALPPWSAPHAGTESGSEVFP